MDLDKIKQLASEHPDQVNQGIEKGGDLLDEKTGGRFAGQVDQGQQAAHAQFGGANAAAPGGAEGQAADVDAAQTPEAPSAETPGPVSAEGEAAASE